MFFLSFVDLPSRPRNCARVARSVPERVWRSTNEKSLRTQGSAGGKKWKNGGRKKIPNQGKDRNEEGESRLSKSAITKLRQRYRSPPLRPFGLGGSTRRPHPARQPSMKNFSAKVKATPEKLAKAVQSNPYLKKAAEQIKS